MYATPPENRSPLEANLSRGKVGILLHNVELAGHLLAGPPGSLNRAVAKLLVGADLLDHANDPIGAEELGKASVWEGVRKITEETHRGPEKWLGLVWVSSDVVKEAKDGIDMLRENFD